MPSGQAPLQKNDVLEMAVQGYGTDAQGVCRYGEEGFAVFVPGAIPGERIRVRIVKVEKRHAYGRLEQVIAPSETRVEPPCPVYRRCGGCAAQHMAYAATLAYKREQVRGCLARIGRIDTEVAPVLGMEHPWRYRNKGAFPVAGAAGEPHIGFFAPRSHEVIDAPAGCLIQHPVSDAAVAVIRAWMVQYRVAPYNEATHTGVLRHIMTRTTRAGGVMIVLISREPTLPAEAALISALTEHVPGLASVLLNHHDRRTNVILGAHLRTLWGTDTLEDTLHGLVFRVSPHSFFQVNPEQTEHLYAQALQYAALTGSETVVDAYCGAGTISLMLARDASRVIGIEVVPQAIADARHNAARNGISNATFIEGNAEELLPGLVAEGLKPDVVVMDPPRKGCDPALLQAIVRAEPLRVVYVSCNPATLARDAALLTAGGYRVDAVQPVDMFCWTGDVETCVLLSHKNSQTSPPSL